MSTVIVLPGRIGGIPYRGFVRLVLLLALVGCGFSACERRSTQDRAEMEEPAKPDFGDVSRLTDAELRSAVDGYVNSQQQSREYWLVCEIKRVAPGRLAPELVRVVLAPGSERASKPDSAGLGGNDSPLQRALQMLDAGQHPELLQRFIDLAAHSDPGVRATVASHLAAFGSDETIEPLQRLLSDAETSVANAAASGLLVALDAGRGSDRLRTELFEPVEQLVRTEQIEGDLLLALDRGKAVAVLLEMLPENTLRSHHALEVLMRGKAAIEPGVLLALLEQNKTPDPKQPWRSYFYGNVLLALAQAKRPEARILVEQILAEKESPAEKGTREYQNERLRRQEVAARAMLVLEGFEYPAEKLWARWQRLGRSGVTEVERDLGNVVDAEVCNGGFVQYFLNIDHDPREDIAALKRIGTVEHTAILERACAAFGKKGPAPDAETRRKQLENRGEKEEAILSQCDDEWFHATESLTVLTSLYALKHRELLMSLE